MWKPIEREPTFGRVQQRNINMLYTVIHFLSYQKEVTIKLILAQPCYMVSKWFKDDRCGLLHLCLQVLNFLTLMLSGIT